MIVLPHPGTAVAAITKAATDRFIIAKMTNRTKNLMVIARQGSYRNNAIDRLGIFGAKCHRRTAAQTVSNHKDRQMRRVFLGPINDGFKIIRKMIEIAINAMWSRCLTVTTMIIAIDGNMVTNEIIGHIVITTLMPPQTMNDKTLETIGRSHRAADIERAFGQAREAGFVDINMDVIVGLPGEGRCELAHTIAGITKLRPDCLTVHSLARKRAARLTEEWEKYADTSFENSEMYMKMFEHAARAMGMVPYYLYRQKNMAGNLENTGYALPERPCLYNILIMEEKQPIIACGAGGASKYTIDGTKTDRSENVKDPEEYISRIDEMIERKREKLKELTWL